MQCQQPTDFNRLQHTMSDGSRGGEATTIPAHVTSSTIEEQAELRSRTVQDITSNACQGEEEGDANQQYKHFNARDSGTRRFSLAIATSMSRLRDNPIKGEATLGRRVSVATAQMDSTRQCVDIVASSMSGLSTDSSAPATYHLRSSSKNVTAGNKSATSLLANCTLDAVARKISLPSMPIYLAIEKVLFSESIRLCNVRNMYDLKVLCLKKCQQKLSLPLIRRSFVSLRDSNCKETISQHGSSVTIMQWNVLSQAIGFYYEGFVTCRRSDLLWSARKWKIIFEIAQYSPDVICLQEVDRFGFIQRVLSRVGYEGKFLPKPDSPCYHIPGNSGPDGAAIFYNTKKFSLVKLSSRILEVCGELTNQVILMVHLRCKATGRTFAAATTHLKARKGPILAAFRNEQGKDILNFLAEEAGQRALVLTGDFNAESNEPIYETMVDKLSSAYCEAFPGENLVTNWTRRADEDETKQTVDYMFHSPNNVRFAALLDLYSEELISPLPNDRYPSDHLSLVGKFTFL